jgi:hypothetical protein
MPLPVLYSVVGTLCINAIYFVSVRNTGPSGVGDPEGEQAASRAASLLAKVWPLAVAGITPSAAVAFGKDREELEAKQAKERQKEGAPSGGKAGRELQQASTGTTRDKTGEAPGMSGKTPAAIAEACSTLQLADVYGVITYYLRHREEVK